MAARVYIMIFLHWHLQIDYVPYLLLSLLTIVSIIFGKHFPFVIINTS